MPLKATPNIDFMLQAAKEYIDGTGNPLDFELDYGYELEKRWNAMAREDIELANLIYECLVREGSDYATDEKSDTLRKRIKKQYAFVMSVKDDRS